MQEGEINLDKKNLKKTVSLFIVGVILSIGILPVFAYTTYDSPYGYYGPVFGKYYQNQSYVIDWGGSTGVAGGARVETQNGVGVPTGYMGVNAWLYKDDVLVDSSGWNYNTETTYLIAGTTTPPYTSSGEYYADGQTRAYNGNGYDTYGVFSSPILDY